MKFPNFICSYLTAWYRKSKIDEKVFLLNEHITTVREHLTHGRGDLDVLFGIQAFFYNENIEENKSNCRFFMLNMFKNYS
jgi:hypothetical protein